MHLLCGSRVYCRLIKEGKVVGSNPVTGIRNGSHGKATHTHTGLVNSLSLVLLNVFS